MIFYSYPIVYIIKLVISTFQTRSKTKLEKYELSLEDLLERLLLLMNHKKLLLVKGEEQLKRNLSEDLADVGGRSPEQTTKLIPEYIHEYRKIVDNLKERYENKCQICDFTFGKSDGGGTIQKVII